MTQDQFIKQIQENRGIIQTVVNLYADSPEDRDDLFQEILLQCWKSIENFKGDSKFSTWLYRVGMNIAITFFKKSSKNKSIISSSKNLCSVNKADDQEVSSDNSEKLFHAIKQLNDIEKMIITLHLEGYSNEEIADMIDVSNANLRVKIHRIKEKLTKKLKNN